ncbi:MAG TPA: low affinity iron permease family protein [Alphaproteobacteria bacterium]|jgi:low affinity Fe/Cu permease
MMNRLFGRLAHATVIQTGRPHTFALAVAVIVVWCVSGPIFGWSDTWQLVINTGTTIVTFLMVFLIQYSQNRDTQSIHIKLDELIRATKDADDNLIDLEELTAEDLEALKLKFEKAAKARCMSVEQLLSQKSDKA